ncbi:MerR family transcriptional regulator, partial [Streptomyces sp. WAC07061]
MGSSWPFHIVGATAILLNPSRGSESSESEERAMADQATEPMLTVDELASKAGVTVRTVRFYSTRGLLPPPVIGPRRVGHYGPEHLSRLALIEELQHQGMTLSAIQRYLDALP